MGAAGVDQIPTVSSSLCGFTPTDCPSTCLSESSPQYWVLFLKLAHVYFGVLGGRAVKETDWTDVKSQVKLITPLNTHSEPQLISVRLHAKRSNNARTQMYAHRHKHTYACPSNTHSKIYRAPLISFYPPW